MTKRRAHIKGIAGYVPEKIFSNYDLEKIIDTSNEWIFERTGIKERRILEYGKGTSEICLKAFGLLKEKIKINENEIDLVVACTSTPDYRISNLASYLAKSIGANNAFAYDIGAACSGFIYGLSTASAFIESGRYKKILVFGADKMSSVIDYSDRATSIIFGDGGGVALLEEGDENYGFINEYLGSNGEGEKYLRIEYGGSKIPLNESNIKEKKHFLFQNGRIVFKYAVSEMTNSIKKLIEYNNISIDNIDWILPHQANIRIIQAVAENLNIPTDKVLTNIERYGNTTNGTIPLLMHDFENKFKKGDKLILVSFGAGFTWGAQYIKWAY